MLSTGGVTADAGAMGKRIIRSPDGLRQSPDLFDGQMPDCIQFHQDGKPEADNWKFNFLKFGPDVKFEHDSNIDCDKWLVVIFEPDGEEDLQAHYFQCYLGDPFAFVRNHVKAGVSGFIIKKSLPGFNILIEALKLMPLANILSFLEQDLQKFITA